MKKKNFTGLTADTTKHLALGAGAFFIDYDIKTDTYAKAKTANKILGATQGGGEFSAKPTYRQTEADGATGRVKGLADIEKWDVYIKATVIETTVDIIKKALGAAASDAAQAPSGYTEIKGKSSVDESDYIGNITWVGCLSGSNEPIVIQVYNALNEDGFTLKTEDKNESKISCTFYGYNDLDDFINDTVSPPFAIYYPKINEQQAAQSGE